jgi:hypothetical protein
MRVLGALRRVLIVDDDPVLLKSARDIPEAGGQVVTVAGVKGASPNARHEISPVAPDSFLQPKSTHEL